MMEQVQISDNVVRKIQLLLNLASRAQGNEVEAAAAMAKAQDLLAQYNLDLATVQDKVVAGGTNTPEDALAKRDYARANRSAMYQWQRDLVRALAEANYCRYWVTEVTGPSHLDPKVTVTAKRYKILGRVANTTSVLVMVDYLMDTIERLLPFPNKERMSRDANAWRTGCAERLIERVQAKAEAMRKADFAAQGEQAYSTALAVQHMASAEEIGNYDFINGEGAWARKQARDAEYTAKSAQRAREREERDAWELAELEAKLALETPEQKAKREAREAKEQAKRDKANYAYSARYWARADREAERAAAKRSSPAYRAGRSKGGEIGLDAQVSAGKQTPRLG